MYVNYLLGIALFSTTEHCRWIRFVKACLVHNAAFPEIAHEIEWRVSRRRHRRIECRAVGATSCSVLRVASKRVAGKFVIELFDGILSG